jgi:hypothetical protein
MQTASRYIIAAGIGSFVLSLLYFLSLVIHVPFVITVPVIFISVLAVFIWVLKGATPAVDKTQHPYWAGIILLAGVYTIITGFFPLAEKYGGWDAWGIWNMHAKYLADADNWKKMFANSSFAHPDYPLYIPAVNGFFIRLFSAKYTMVIPFIFNFAITLFIPVLIYLENLRKNIVVAAIVFSLFAFDTFFLTKGATQYADTPLAFFLLCAFICINYAGEGRKYITLCALSLGCCMWTKNEGTILALIFMGFYARTFLSRKNIGAFAAGIVLPLLVFLVFKVLYAPDAAIVSGQNAQSFRQLFIKDRYDMVWDFFKNNVAQKYWYVKICVFIYLLLCLLERKIPDKQFFLLLLCTLAYTMIYILTPGGIEWLLDTSQERLMHQLMPALMYVLSMRFVTVQFSLAKQDAL